MYVMVYVLMIVRVQVRIMVQVSFCTCAFSVRSLCSLCVRESRSDR